MRIPLSGIILNFCGSSVGGVHPRGAVRFHSASLSIAKNIAVKISLFVLFISYSTKHLFMQYHWRIVRKLLGLLDLIDVIYRSNVTYIFTSLFWTSNVYFDSLDHLDSNKRMEKYVTFVLSFIMFCLHHESTAKSLS